LTSPPVSPMPVLVDSLIRSHSPVRQVQSGKRTICVKPSIPRKYLFVFVALVLFVALLFGLAMIGITRGHLAAPLDDSYIHFQYARQISRGHFFEFTDGSGFSTGCTSLLYPVLLAPFFIVGFGGVKIILIALALGLGCLVASSLLLFLSGRELAGEEAGLLVSLLFLCNGNLVWQYLSGMETGLFATLILAGLYCLILWERSNRGKHLGLGMALFSLASLTRPEGLALLLIALVLVTGRSLRRHGAGVSALLYLFLLPFLFYLLAVRISSGTFETAGVLAKSVGAAPYYTFWEKIAKLVDNFTLIFTGYYRGLGHNFFPDGSMAPFFPAGALYPFLLFPPGSLILAGIGVVAGISTGDEKIRRMIRLIGFLLFGGLLSVTNSEVVEAHYFRYLGPFQPLFLLLVVVGIREIAGLFRERSRGIFRTAGIGLVLFAVPSIFYWAYIYGENASDIFEQHRRTSWWIKDATPGDAVIGVTDTGVIGYFSNRRIYDFVGLTTPNQARHWRSGIGSAFERLERLPPDKRPDYIVSFPFLFGEMNFLGEPVHWAPLQKNLTTMGNQFVVYRQEWSLLHSGDLPIDPPEGLHLVDSLDVADLEDEHVHGYSWREAAERHKGWMHPNPRNFFHKAAAENRTVADGGRLLSGIERFTIQIPRGGEILLVARMKAKRKAVANVFMNGKSVGRLEVPGSEKDSWQEPRIRIPPDVVQKGNNEVEIRFERDRSSSLTLVACHYWFFQED